MVPDMDELSGRVAAVLTSVLGPKLAHMLELDRTKEAANDEACLEG